MGKKLTILQKKIKKEENLKITTNGSIEKIRGVLNINSVIISLHIMKNILVH